jgi:response regulator of citrate/malate metabolism
MATQGKRPPLTDATLRAIVAELQNQAEQPPPGFHTWQTWSKRWNLKRTSTMRYLEAGVKSGILETVMIRQDVGAYVRRAPFWGLKGKAPKKQRS